MHTKEQTVDRENTSVSDDVKKFPISSRLQRLLRRLAGAKQGTVCIGGYAGCGNIGDDAILQGFLSRVLREGMPRVMRRNRNATAYGFTSDCVSSPHARDTVPHPIRDRTLQNHFGQKHFVQDNGGIPDNITQRCTTQDLNTGEYSLVGDSDLQHLSADLSHAAVCTSGYSSLLRQITVLSGAPKRDTRRFCVRCVNRKNPFSLLSVFLRSEYFLCGGGSLLQNATGNLSLFYYLGLLRLARLCGCRTALLSAGIGPLHGEFARQAVARELNRCEQVNLRDPDSLRSLLALGVRRELLSLSPDPAFFMPPPPPSRLPFLLREAGISSHAGYFCVVLHAPCGGSPELMQVITASLRRVAECHSLLPVFLLFDTKADGYPSDRISKAVGGKILRLREAADAVAVISGAQFLFSMRLHALIFSVIACTPALALSVSPCETKLESFSRSTGIPHLRSPSIVTLVDNLELLMKNENKIRAVLPDVLEDIVSTGSNVCSPFRSEFL